MKNKISIALASAIIAGSFGAVANAETVIKVDNVEIMRRYSGNDRNLTAVDVSKGNYPNGAKNVVLVNGTNPADALSGGPLAYKLDAPILLTESRRIQSAVLTEIQRLKPDTVYILGGENSISSTAVEGVVKSKLKTGAKIVRISGTDRYETSVKIAETIIGTSNFSGAGFVNGDTKKFPDALSAAALLGKKNMPLILTNGRTLSSSMEKYKSSSNNYIIGGTNTINISKLSGKRLAGNDRYETSAKVASEGFVYGTSSTASNGDSAVVVVNGRDYPDALTAISVARKQNAPILLVDKDLPSSISNYITAQKRDKGYIVGGINSVSTATQNNIANRLYSNYKNYRGTELDKKRTAVENLRKAMVKYDEIVGYLSKNSTNTSVINNYKSYRDQLYRDYISKDVRSLTNVTVANIESYQTELIKKFDEIAKIQDSQYSTILSNEMKKAQEEKLSQNGVPILESNMSSSQKALNSKIKEANSILYGTDGKKKLELAYEIRHFSVSSSGSGNTTNSNSTIKAAADLLNQAEYIRTDSTLYKTARSDLQDALTDARKSATTANINNLRDKTIDFENIYKSYKSLEDRIGQLEKLLNDNKSLIEYTFTSEVYKNTFKDDSKNLKGERKNVQEVIRSGKDILSKFENRQKLYDEEQKVYKKYEDFTKVLRNFERLKEDLDKTLRNIESYKYVLAVSDTATYDKLSSNDKKRVDKLKTENPTLFNEFKGYLDRARKIGQEGSDIDLKTSGYEAIRDLNKDLSAKFDEYRTAYNNVKIN